MSKTVSVDLAAHLEQEVTTLARCWKITRVDGLEFFFTDHDVDIVFDGDAYLAMEGFSPTAITTDASLDVDNVNVLGVFDDESIQEKEIEAGLFDYASVRLFVVNWADITQGILKLRRGWFGEAIKSPSGIFKVELRGMTQVLQQTLGELYGPECRADLGDHRCKVPIDPDEVQRETTYAIGDYVKVVTDVGADGYARYEDRIYKVITAGTTDAVQPTFDTVVGHTTQDGGTGGSTTSTFTGPMSNFTFGQFVRIDDLQYTFVSSLGASSPGNVLIGATESDSMDNLFAAITLGPGAGTTYNINTPANTAISATQGANTITVALANLVIPGTKVLLSHFVTGASWSAASLSSASNPVVFEAVEAWSRGFTVDTVTSRKIFSIVVSEPRDVDGWFSGGVVTFDTGDNAGRAFEVKNWTQSGAIVTLFLPVGFAIQAGDTGRIYPGCDKRLDTCRDIFDNLINMRAESYLPGRDSALSYPDAK